MGNKTDYIKNICLAVCQEVPGSMFRETPYSYNISIPQLLINIILEEEKNNPNIKLYMSVVLDDPSDNTLRPLIDRLRISKWENDIPRYIAFMCMAQVWSFYNNVVGPEPWPLETEFQKILNDPSSVNKIKYSRYNNIHFF